MQPSDLPNFSKQDMSGFPKKLDELLQHNLQVIRTVLKENTSYTWENLMQPLEEAEDALEKLWSPISHLHAVQNSKELRDCYRDCLPKLSSYEAAIGHNHDLYMAIQAIDKTSLNSVQKKIIEDAIRDFKLSGVALHSEDKVAYEKIQTRLSELSNLYENHILDASQAFQLHIEEAGRLEGLPLHALDAAKNLAKEKGLAGYVLNLEFPCFVAVVTYAKDRKLREEIYHAYVTRASDKGPNAGQFDNTPLMQEILSLRQEKARLLGFADYAEYSLASKMAESPEQVLNFIYDLAKKSYPQALQEFKELVQFAKAELQMDKLEPWDIAYVSELKQQKIHSISQEELRPYFPLPKVMQGLFEVAETLFGIFLRKVEGVDTWHSDVLCYELLDKQNNCRGYLYADLFARKNKRGGAWMDSAQSRRKLADGSIQLPIAFLTCNFAKAITGKPAMLSHDEVLTLFHEFGHCIHHLLTKVDYISVSGINGVEWDAVELPSQFMENWCWEEEALGKLTAHVDNDEPLPKEKFQKLLAAKNFLSGMAMVRQLEFSLFDFRMHKEFKAGEQDFIRRILSEVRALCSVVPQVPYNRFENSFSHVFAGGYAAGYYSYKWAEVLSSDAFARFEEEGIFNEKTGRDFLESILEVGGSCKALQAFRKFRGRDPSVEPLLRHNGILIS